MLNLHRHKNSKGENRGEMGRSLISDHGHVSKVAVGGIRNPARWVRPIDRK